MLEKKSDQPKNDQVNSGKDKKDSSSFKKSFSSQRPVNDRQNRRGPPGEHRKSNSGERVRDNHNQERSPPATKNGTAGNNRTNSANSKTNRTTFGSQSRKENVNHVYRVDEIVPTDPNAINNAINNLNNK